MTRTSEAAQGLTDLHAAMTTTPERSRPRRLVDAIARHGDAIVCVVSLTLVGWIMPSTDRFGYILGLVVALPWALYLVRDDQ